MFDNDTYTVLFEGFEIDLTIIEMVESPPFEPRPRYMYYAIAPNGAAFDGDQYMPSPHAVNLGIWAIAIDLIDWINLSPGDTDQEFFADYTEEQLAWANSPECEMWDLMGDRLISGNCELSDPMVEYNGLLWSAYCIEIPYADVEVFGTPEDPGDTEIIAYSMLIRRGLYTAPMVAEEAIADPIEEEAYNGWSNRTTWNIALWAMNTEWRYNIIRISRDHGRFAFNAESARHMSYMLLFTDGITPDGYNLENADWQEIASAYNEVGGN